MRGALCLLVFVACGDDDDPVPADAASPDVALPVDAAPDAAAVDAGPNGEASGTLKVFAAVTFQYFPRQDRGEPFESFRAVFDVRDLADQPVDGANVQLAVGGVVHDAMPSGPPGQYGATLVGFSPTIRVDVDRGPDFLHGAMLRAPAEFSIGIRPEPPVHLEPATVSWPAVEADTASVVQVFDARSTPTHPSVVEDPEDGSSELPATAFPATGTYELRVDRETTTDMAGPQSTGKVRLSTGRLLAVIE